MAHLGRLGPEAATQALVAPARELGVTYEPAAVKRVLGFTKGYPFFLQVYGDLLWKSARGSVITQSDVRRVEPLVRETLDRGFFTFRTDKLTPPQLRYLRAMAESGPDEVSSVTVATTLGLADSSLVRPVRDELPAGSHRVSEARDRRFPGSAVRCLSAWAIRTGARTPATAGGLPPAQSARPAGGQRGATSAGPSGAARGSRS